MLQQKLVSLLSTVIEPSIPKADEYMVHCPYCFHRKKKLAINLVSHKWHCWICAQAGNRLSTLFYKFGASDSNLKALIKLVPKTSYNIDGDKKENNTTVSLPLEFIPITAGSYNSMNYRNAVKYLKKRNITKYDILRYNIGYCETGAYSNMIIFPSYDSNGKVNFFVGRAYYESGFKHKLPNVTKDIIGNELLINWNEPINIVESPIDAISTGDNTVPLYGTNILSELKLKIVQNNVSRINIILDGDAIKRSIAHSEYFMNNGISVHLIGLGDKDPNEIGKKGMADIITSSTPTDSYQIMTLKIEN